MIIFGMLLGVIAFIFGFILLPLGLIQPSIFAPVLGEKAVRQNLGVLFGSIAFTALFAMMPFMPTAEIGHEAASTEGVDSKEVISSESNPDEKQVLGIANIENDNSEQEEVKSINDSVTLEDEREDAIKSSGHSSNSENHVVTGQVLVSGQVNAQAERAESDSVTPTQKSPKPAPVSTPAPTPSSPNSTPAPAATPAPTVKPKPLAPPTTTSRLSCDPHYSPCVPVSVPDLNCSDIRMRVTVKVIGQDPHGFDRDKDGVGCESY